MAEVMLFQPVAPLEVVRPHPDPDIEAAFQGLAAVLEKEGVVSATTIERSGVAVPDAKVDPTQEARSGMPNHTSKLMGGLAMSEGLPSKTGSGEQPRNIFAEGSGDNGSDGSGSGSSGSGGSGSGGGSGGGGGGTPLPKRDPKKSGFKPGTTPKKDPKKK